MPLGRSGRPGGGTIPSDSVPRTSELSPEFGRASHGCRMNFGMTELLIILVIAVVIFGANRLPELGRGLGKGIRNFKDATRDAADEGRPEKS